MVEQSRPEQTPGAEDTARAVKRDLDQGNVEQGADRLRNDYVAWMRSGRDENQFWQGLRTVGVTDQDMQNMSLAFARQNWAGMSERSAYNSQTFITPESLSRWDAQMRQGGTPESRFAQHMDRYLSQALQRPEFQHGFFGLSWENLAHGTGAYITPESLTDRINAINVEDRGRAIAGDIARGLNAPGSDGRTLFDRMTNGGPMLTPEMVRRAHQNIGAYSGSEQIVIQNLMKGLTDGGAEEQAWNLLRDPQRGGVTRDRLQAALGDPSMRNPYQAPEQPRAGEQQRGEIPQATARAAVDTVMTVPQDQQRKFLDEQGRVTRQSLDRYLNDPANAAAISANQRQGLQQLRDALPQDNTPMALNDLARRAGYLGADGQPTQALTERIAAIKADGRQTVTGLHDHVDGRAITGQDGNITRESIAARMRALEEQARAGGQQPGANPEYAALQRFNERFNDISSNGTNITRADLDRYSRLSTDQNFAGFKNDAGGPPEQQPQRPTQQQIQQDGDEIARGRGPDTSFRLGRGPIIQQVMEHMQRNGEQVTPQAARQRLAEIARANNWPGTEQQWNNYVQTGRMSALPRELNFALRGGMEVRVPGRPMTAEQTQQAINERAQQRVATPNLELTPGQMASARQFAPQLANATPQQINDYVARHPQFMSQQLTPEQVAKRTQYAQQVQAYTQALTEYVRSKQQQQPQPRQPEGPPAAPPRPVPPQRRRTA